MPKLTEHHASSLVKLILIGDSGAGKTGSLISLIREGYKLRILDLDNGLDSVVALIRHEGLDASNVEYESRRDVYKAIGSGEPICLQPKAFAESLKLMDKWSDGTSPAEWGADTIFVIDSFTALGRAAFEWARGMKRDAKEPRQWYFAAQQALEAVVGNLAGSNFNTNLILISHISYRELQDGTVKGYPSAIGQAFGPTFAKYFNTLLLCETSGMGKNTTRNIKTLPNGIIDLKNPAPFAVEASYPINTGLADIFKHLKGEK